MKTRSQALFDIPHRDPALPRALHRSLLVVGLGLLAAALDLATALVYWAPHGLTFSHLLRSIASWVLGPHPPDTLLVQTTGWILHVLIYVSMALVFDRLLARRGYRVAQWFAPGALFGLIAYVLVFRLLVPALVFPVTLNQSPAWVATCVLAHMLVIGPLMAWGLTRGAREA